MNILVTNDDGVHARGLRILAEELRNVGRVTVIGPDRERSAVAHAFSMHHPVRAREIEPGVVQIDGTPTDCVMFGVLGYLEEKPDLVVSGINMGPNLGDDVTYSGTVAAALEGTMMGASSFAVSLVLETFGEPGIGEEFHIETASRFALILARHIGDAGLPEGVFLNVNVPNRPWNDIKGVEITRLGKRIYRDKIIRRLDPQGQPYYWIGGEPPHHVKEQGTDFDAIEQGKISVTPLRFELTAKESLQVLRDWNISLDGRDEDNGAE